MFRAILMAFQPKRAGLLLNKLIQLESRRMLPSELKDKIEKGGGMWFYAYCTKGSGYDLIHHRDFDKEYLNTSNMPNYTITESEIDFDRFGSVLNGKIVGRFWVDDYTKLVNIFGLYVLVNKEGKGIGGVDILKEICLTEQELFDYGNGKDIYLLHINKLEVFDEPMELSDFWKEGFDETIHTDLEAYAEGYETLEKAPQSWQYVWVKEEKNV